MPIEGTTDSLLSTYTPDIDTPPPIPVATPPRYPFLVPEDYVDLTTTGFSLEDIQFMLDNIEQFSPEEQEELYRMFETYDEQKGAEDARNDLIAFCIAMQPDYKVGKHHRILADLLMQLEASEYSDTGIRPAHPSGIKLEPVAPTAQVPQDRICVNIPPRHGKSQLVSVYFPAWYLGRNPNKKVMMVSHTTDLAVDFGRKVRNIVNSSAYKAIFPGVTLSPDSKSAGRWNTNHLGEYYATGIGSSIAGRGADLLLVDDPHSEQDILNGNFEAFDRAYEWFTYGARTRLMPKGRVAVIQTRWHLKDLTGRLTQDMVNNPLADQYEVVEFPAILEIPQHTEELDEDGILTPVTRIIEKPLWPEFFDLDALYRTKASMPLFQWNAQYQQKPTSEEGAIVKREWWQIWDDEDPPECEYIICALDAAAEAHNKADFTSLTTWGIFTNDKTADGVTAFHIILLDSIKRRMEFPELKDLALKHYNEWKPDAFIVEKKSSGTPLYQELRRMGVMVQEYTPVRGTMNTPNNKMVRLNSVADIIRSGICWVPDRRWAEELVEEVAGFPFAPNDDTVDTTIMALMRFRQGGFIRLPGDPAEEAQQHKRPGSKRYY